MLLEDQVIFTGEEIDAVSGIGTKRHDEALLEAQATLVNYTECHRGQSLVKFLPEHIQEQDKLQGSNAITRWGQQLAAAHARLVGTIKFHAMIEFLALLRVSPFYGALYFQVSQEGQGDLLPQTGKAIVMKRIKHTTEYLTSLTCTERFQSTYQR